MTDSRTSKDKPTEKQMRYLKDLAHSRGESFRYPRTRREAGEEIERLKGRAKTPTADRRREERVVRDRVAVSRSDSASVRDEEIEGYGSGARWA